MLISNFKFIGSLTKVDVPELGKVKVSVHLKSVGDQQKFVKRLSFEKQLDDQNMERLLLIASKCPISKLLSQENIMDLAHLNE